MTTKKTQPKLNLYEKLVLVRKSVPYMKKEASGHRYQYATESQILAAIRETMDDLGLLLYQDMVAYERFEKGTAVTFKYTWINAENPSETLSCTQYMCEPGFDAKAIGAMMTYGNKYFLYKFLNVPTDKDDPDAFQAKADARKPKPMLTKEQSDHLMELIGDRQDILDAIFISYKVSGLDHIAEDQYATLMNGIKARLANGQS